MTNILNQLIFIDTETTGLEEKDKLFQVAYEFQNKEYSELFKPPIPISYESMETTHYTNEDVKNKQPFQNSKMYEHLNEILPKNIFVAHNAKFDIKMIEKENLKVVKFIDTLKITQALDSNGKLDAYRLQYLRYRLDLKVENAQAHDALGDIRVLKALFLRLFEKLKQEIKDDKKVIAKMIDISKKPVLIKKFTFGKYKGQLVKNIAITDKKYLEWLLKEKEKQASEGDKDEDWLHTLRFYLK